MIGRCTPGQFLTHGVVALLILCVAIVIPPAGLLWLLQVRLQRSFDRANVRAARASHQRSVEKFASTLKVPR